jgi:multiple antibiotic resistance protein
MELLSAMLTLFLVMDPIGNVPLFLVYLKNVEERRRTAVVVRESCIALAILLFFLLFGPMLMDLLRIQPAALHIAGGVLLFLIAVGMIFPGAVHLGASDAPLEEEPFLVPLATPLLAGPSAIATIMIFSSKQTSRLGEVFVVLALVVAWIATTAILMLSPRLSRLLGHRGLIACERLMGMTLTVIAVQMFLDGLRLFLSLPKA